MHIGLRSLLLISVLLVGLQEASGEAQKGTRGSECSSNCPRSSNSQSAADAQNQYESQLNQLTNRDRQQQADFDRAMQQRLQQEGQAAQDDNAQLRQNAQEWRNGQGQQARDKPTPKIADTTQGCPYLVKTNYGLIHPPGAEYCTNNKTLRCVRGDANSSGQTTYRWLTLSEDRCQLGISTPDIDEANTTRLVDINKKFFEEF